MTQMRPHNWLIASCIINEFEKVKSQGGSSYQNNLFFLDYDVRLRRKFDLFLTVHTDSRLQMKRKNLYDNFTCKLSLPLAYKLDNRLCFILFCFVCLLVFSEH